MCYTQFRVMFRNVISLIFNYIQFGVMFRNVISLIFNYRKPDLIKSGLGLESGFDLLVKGEL
jgi:hypothetical protein